MNTRCAGSEVWAEPPYFEYRAICPACFQLVHIRPDGDGFRLFEHSRVLPVDPADDRMFVPEWDDKGEAA